MIRAIVDFIYGTVTLRVFGRERIIDLLMHYNVSYSYMKREDDGLIITLSRKEARYLGDILSKKGEKYEKIDEKGAVMLSLRLLERPGLIVGALLFALILFSSSRHIWDIRVDGNEKLSSSVIEERLSDYGCSPGANIKNLDLRSLCNKFMRDYDDISFMSVNMDGTIARVQIKEMRESVRRDDDVTSPSVIVASRDAQIERFEVSSGKLEASVGQVVKKGQMLVSGIMDYEGKTKIGGASGKVMARTLREIEVFCPAKEEIVKSGSGDSGNITLSSVYSYGNLHFDAQKLTNNKNKYSISDKDYVIIKSTRRSTLFGKILLPIYKTEETALPTKKEEVSYSQDEMKRIAEELLQTKIESELPGARILRIARSDESDGRGYRIKCRIEAIEDIAEKVYIGVNNTR